MPEVPEAPIISASPTPARERRLALGLAAFALVANAVATWLSAIARGRGTAFTSTLGGEAATSAFVITLVVLGLVLRRRRPENRVGWLLLVFGAIAGASSLVWSNMLIGLAVGGDRQLGAIGSWIGGILTVPVWNYVIIALVVSFPSGAPASPQEARLLRWTAVLGLLGGLAVAIRPGPIVIYPGFDNPVATPAGWRDALVAVTSVALLASLAPAIAAAMAMVARYRRASAIERLQLRWFAFGAALVIVASVAYLMLGGMVYADNPAIREGTYTLFVLSLCSLPIAVAIAITRYRLYEIDTIIGRTFAYGALTAILAGLYAATVRGLNAVFVALTGEESEAALVLTTLVLATTFTPIKSYLEKIAAKRFPATPDPAMPSATADSAAAAPDDNLDARIEAIARRVAAEVLAERPTSAARAAAARVDTPER